MGKTKWVRTVLQRNGTDMVKDQGKKLTLPEDGAKAYKTTIIPMDLSRRTRFDTYESLRNGPK